MPTLYQTPRPHSCVKYVNFEVDNFIFYWFPISVEPEPHSFDLYSTSRMKGLHFTITDETLESIKHMTVQHMHETFAGSMYGDTGFIWEDLVNVCTLQTMTHRWHLDNEGAGLQTHENAHLIVQSFHAQYPRWMRQNDMMRRAEILSIEILLEDGLGHHIFNDKDDHDY